MKAVKLRAASQREGVEWGVHATVYVRQASDENYKDIGKR